MAAVEERVIVRISNRPDYPGYSPVSANSIARRLYRTDIQVNPLDLAFNSAGDSIDLERISERVYKTRKEITVTFPGENGVRTFPPGTVGDITGGGQGRYFRIGGPLPQLEHAPQDGGRRKSRSRHRHQRRKSSARRQRHTTRRKY